jgi:hypothetical protein
MMMMMILDDLWASMTMIYADSCLSQDVRKLVFGRDASRHVVGFGDLSIYVFLEVQNKRNS